MSDPKPPTREAEWPAPGTIVPFHRDVIRDLAHEIRRRQIDIGLVHSEHAELVAALATLCRVCEVDPLEVMHYLMHGAVSDMASGWLGHAAADVADGKPGDPKPPTPEREAGSEERERLPHVWDRNRQCVHCRPHAPGIAECPVRLRAALDAERERKAIPMDASEREALESGSVLTREEAALLGTPGDCACSDTYSCHFHGDDAYTLLRLARRLLASRDVRSEAERLTRKAPEAEDAPVGMQVAKQAHPETGEILWVRVEPGDPVAPESEWTEPRVIAALDEVRDHLTLAKGRAEKAEAHLEAIRDYVRSLMPKGYASAAATTEARDAMDPDDRALFARFDTFVDNLIGDAEKERDAALADTAALRTERDAARKMLAECTILSGADTDGNTLESGWEHLWKGAVEEVRELRKDYDDDTETATLRAQLAAVHAMSNHPGATAADTTKALLDESEALFQSAVAAESEAKRDAAECRRTLAAYDAVHNALPGWLRVAVADAHVAAYNGAGPDALRADLALSAALSPGDTT